MKEKLEATGCTPFLMKEVQRERTYYQFNWVDEGGVHMSKNYPYTKSGKKLMLAIRDIHYERLGNKNGIRTEYGDGIIPV
jgi:hypothetical protein